MHCTRPASVALAAAAALVVVSVTVIARGQQPPSPSSPRPTPEDGIRFRSGIELINVTATVSDRSGRFVPDLRKEDFVVYDDDQPVEVTHFSAERVPVSLGITLDTSGSMAGTKMREAQAALERFVYELLGSQDEVFLYLFNNYPTLAQGWTTDRRLIARALGGVRASGGTAMYDAVIEALPLAASGQHSKKALVVISDGNDTASDAQIADVKRRIREGEVMVYAVGIDGELESTIRRLPPSPPRVPFPVPFPFPPRGRGRFSRDGLLQLGAQGGPGRWSRSGDNRVNVAALRDMTDDSGGRTEVVRDARDLDPATAAIANELSKQYYLAYPVPNKKDGRWHSIRVEVRNSPYRVRARKGYVAS